MLPACAPNTYKVVPCALFFRGCVGSESWGLFRRLRAQQSDDKEPAKRNSLKKACAKDDTRAAAAALLDWARTAWPDRNLPGLMPAAAPVRRPLKREIEALHTALYGQGGPWTGAALWDAFKAERGNAGEEKRTPKGRASVLQASHRLE